MLYLLTTKQNLMDVDSTEDSDFEMLTRGQKKILSQRNTRKFDKAKQLREKKKQKKIQDDENRLLSCENCAYESLTEMLILTALHPTDLSRSYHVGRLDCEAHNRNWITIFPLYRQILHEAGHKIVLNYQPTDPHRFDAWGWKTTYEPHEIMGPEDHLDWKNTKPNRKRVRKAFKKLRRNPPPTKEQESCFKHGHRPVEDIQNFKIRIRTFYIWMVEFQRSSDDYHPIKNDEEELKCLDGFLQCCIPQY